MITQRAGTIYSSYFRTEVTVKFRNEKFKKTEETVQFS